MDVKTGQAEAALSAVRLIDLAKQAAEVKRPLRRILDLPCGTGRIMGALREAFPDAELTACDIDREAVDHCAEEFGAVTAYSAEDLGSIKLDGPFDLIWSGSFVTHLPAEKWDGFLDLCERHLAHRGLLIFTTCGRRIANRLRDGHQLGPEDPAKMVREYEQTGFAYRDYPPAILSETAEWSSGAWGLSLSAPWWVCRKVSGRNFRVVSLVENGFSYHQDAIGLVYQPR